ncbi:fatty acid desaturase family protein [Acidiferrimicrobium sp. IK]|uniref:fatty acid desaturase family protein n=1 Tax=Acidiferrimicrobium sp. IK TaxID=2871700 RepID=UPI0021CB4CD2|nr:fatty acid desaturase family protein [Acidiferrimicrobium sp. IK]MCU4184246.1 fatty acid desaturase family protein [Acidiferrimicrobium sp. IK]
MLTMVPGPDRLPDSLPTDRVSASGKLRPDIREGLRRVDGRRNALTVAGAWAQTFGVIAVAAWVDRWWAFVLAFVLMGRGFALLNILGHEAAHRLLFGRRSVNDRVGKWALAYPGLVPIDIYRRSHMAHHRDEMGPEEPDLGLYRGYPVTSASLRRKLTRDLVGISGWKNLKPLLKALTKPGSRRPAGEIVATQAVIAAVLTAGGGLAFGVWWLYPVLWLAPWMTLWRVNNRLRALAEHGGMIRSSDRRQTTHVVRQRPLARFFMVPYHTGWHLAHHVDAGVPWRNLPAFHDELVAAGWITPAIEYRSYLALWRALSSRPAEQGLATAPGAAAR